MHDQQVNMAPKQNVKQQQNMHSDAEQLAARQITQLLDETLATLDPLVVSKLADARQQAVKLAASSANASRAGIWHVLVDYMQQHRAVMPTSVLACVVFIAFVVTQQVLTKDGYEQGDASLLASELPPEAYADQGFNVWLAQNSQR